MSTLLDAPAAAEDAAARLARHVDPTKESVCLAVRNGDGDDPVVVPMAAFRLFTEILEAMSRGVDAEGVRVPTLVTIAQAADKLNVSREYVVKLLDEGKLAYRSVRAVRLIPYHDLLAYKRVSDAECRRALDELTALSQELGLE